MKNRTITILIAAVIIVLFGIAFIPRVSFTNDNDMEKTLDNIKQAATSDNWELANELSQKLNTLWNQQKNVLMLNYGEADFSTLDTSVARIKSAAEIQELSLVVTECEVSKRLLNNIMKFVPEP